jgi:hypothetical protein
MTHEQVRLRVLYEDRIGDEQIDFPLHRLVVAAAHDCCEGIELWKLRKRIQGIPKKGRDNVLADLGRAHVHINAGVYLLAWLDEDRIRDAFPDVSRSTPNEEVIRRIKAKVNASDPARVEVFLLNRNLESFFEVLEQELGDALDRETVHSAIEKRGKDAVDCRDGCLMHIANSRWLRDLLRTRHQGFDWVTRYVARIATLEPWPFH